MPPSGPPDVAKLAAKRDVPGLLQALGYQEDSDVPTAAAVALATIGDPRAVEPLIAALRDPEQEVREAAAAALGTFGARAVEPLIAALKVVLQAHPAERPGSVSEVAAEREGVGSTDTLLAVPGDTVRSDQTDDPMAVLIKQLLERGRAQPAAPGGEIPGYEIGRPLRSHGMAQVHHATRRSDGQTVAIEIVPDAGAHTRRLYARVVDLAGDLDHPNLVRVLDHGSVDGTSYLVTEYWPAESVASLMERSGGRLTIEQAMPIMFGALDGLAHLHEHGIVHRDLGPANIWLAENGGLAKLTAFELAKRYAAVDDWWSIEDGEPPRGTPVFMPREQVINFGYVKPDTDVCAMAATFYTMLTGTFWRDFPPGRDPVNIILNDPYIPIRERDRSIPLRLAAVIDRAASDDPQERYQTAAELREALERVLRPEPHSIIITRPADESGLAAPTTEQAGHTLPVFERHPARLDLLHAAGQSGRRTALREAWTRHVLQGHTGPVEAVAVALDGRWVVSGSRDNTVRIWDPESGTCLRTLEGHTSVVWAVAMAPDGRWVVSGSDDHTLRIWDPESGACVRTLEGHTDDVNAVREQHGAQQVGGLDV